MAPGSLARHRRPGPGSADPGRDVRRADVTILGNISEAATVPPGTFGAIALISSGITFIAIGRAAKSPGAETDAAR